MNKKVPILKPNQDSSVATILNSFIKAETNLERLPFFAPWTKSRSKRLKHTLSRNVRRDGVNIEISWTVLANPEYGYPNDFDLDVYRAIQQVIHDYYKKGLPENGIISFSFRQLERRMCQGHSGRLKKDIRQSLERMVATTIKSKGAFYYKGTSQYVDDTFHIFDRVTFIGQTMSGGGVAETNYLELSSWYRDSLKTWYVMPLDNNFHFSLRSSNAKALYGILSFYFYARPPGQEWVRRKYSDLCEETIITKHPYFSTGFNKLQRAFNELIAKQFLAKVESQPLTEPNKQDSWIYFWPGERLLHPERFQLKEEQTLLWNEIEEEQRDITEKQPSTQSDIVVLIKQFYAQLQGRSTSSRQISKVEQEFVERWITQHGQECFHQFIEYALEQKRERWPEMASLTGALNAYGDEFIRQFEEQTKREEELVLAQQEHQLIAQLHPIYRQYFTKCLTYIQEQDPSLYAQYEHALNKNIHYHRICQSIAEGNSQWEQSQHAIEENIAMEFFAPESNSNPKTQILHFSDWREQYDDQTLD